MSTVAVATHWKGFRVWNKMQIEALFVSISSFLIANVILQLFASPQQLNKLLALNMFRYFGVSVSVCETPYFDFVYTMNKYLYNCTICACRIHSKYKQIENVVPSNPVTAVGVADTQTQHFALVASQTIFKWQYGKIWFFGFG